ncbi:hypothetical protein BBO_03267 [Beauveria brongniartii RCEF 3172]|uniref:Uncharacterized protein n=1 Tax=Beauveria brongniartii RCEF 3172 TaxID=1081107 RepID=A0A167GJH0_9HYPO|nr:hypothetical protein BBO_03267 [Beauveria brongniartii RCEF 3172]
MRFYIILGLAAMAMAAVTGERTGPDVAPMKSLNTTTTVNGTTTDDIPDVEIPDDEIPDDDLMMKFLITLLMMTLLMTTLLMMTLLMTTLLMMTLLMMTLLVMSKAPVRCHHATGLVLPLPVQATAMQAIVSSTALSADFSVVAVRKVSKSCAANSSNGMTRERIHSHESRFISIVQIV